ncbi:biotin transporter BioY [Cellulomonas soli]
MSGAPEQHPAVPVAPATTGTAAAALPATALPAPTARAAVTTDIALITTFTAFIAVCAILPGIPTPSGVPITLQTFAVILSGVVLGARRGTFAVLLYLVIGLAGLPVFAGGTGGTAVLAGPSVGYLLAFPLGAALAGFLAGRVLRARLDLRLPAAALSRLGERGRELGPGPGVRGTAAAPHAAGRRAVRRRAPGQPADHPPARDRRSDVAARPGPCRGDGHRRPVPARRRREERGRRDRGRLGVPRVPRAGAHASLTPGRPSHDRAA